MVHPYRGAERANVAEHLCYPACELLVVCKFRSRTYVSKISAKNYFVRKKISVASLLIQCCKCVCSQVASLVLDFVRQPVLCVNHCEVVVHAFFKDNKHIVFAL